MLKVVSKELFFVFLGVYVVSLFLNWLVQLGYYHYARRKDPNAFTGQRTLLDYHTGVIGDGIIVPLINILIAFVLLNLHFWPTRTLLVQAFGLALTLNALTHYFQARLALVNWSMPKPYNWNPAGYWHMVSFPIQISYLLLFFFALLGYWEKIMSSVLLRNATLSVFGLMFLFLLLFLKDFRPDGDTFAKTS